MNISHNINLYYTNANDLRNKIHELSLVANEYECKVLCVTETMFHDEILDAEIFVPNFKIFRTTESKKRVADLVYMFMTLCQPQFLMIFTYLIALLLN